MSIKISAVAFLGSESLKLHPMPMGILQLSEIDLLYFNKIPICLASSSDHLGSIFKKTFNYFFIYMGRQNYHFLSWISMIFFLQALLKRGLGFWGLKCPNRAGSNWDFGRDWVGNLGLNQHSCLLMPWLFTESKEPNPEVWNNLASSSSWHHCLTFMWCQLLWVSVWSQLPLFKKFCFTTCTEHWFLPVLS